MCLGGFSAVIVPDVVAARYASEALLQQDRELLLKANAVDGNALYYCPDALKADADFVLEAVQAALPSGKCGISNFPRPTPFGQNSMRIPGEGSNVCDSCFSLPNRSEA